MLMGIGSEGARQFLGSKLGRLVILQRQPNPHTHLLQPLIMNEHQTTLCPHCQRTTITQDSTLHTRSHNPPLSTVNLPSSPGIGIHENIRTHQRYRKRSIITAEAHPMTIAHPHLRHLPCFPERSLGLEVMPQTSQPKTLYIVPRPTPRTLRL